MEGASLREQRNRANIWWGAMLSRMPEPVPFNEFTGIQPDKRAALRECILGWDKVDRALAANKRGEQWPDQ
jgi:hypothetical protein